MTNYGYAVVTINQASRHAEEVNGVHRHVVCELVEVEQ
jgi:hypothetical protein